MRRSGKFVFKLVLYTPCFGIGMKCDYVNIGGYYLDQRVMGTNAYLLLRGPYCFFQNEMKGRIS